MARCAPRALEGFRPVLPMALEEVHALFPLPNRSLPNRPRYAGQYLNSCRHWRGGQPGLLRIAAVRTLRRCLSMRRRVALAQGRKGDLDVVSHLLGRRAWNAA